MRKNPIKNIRLIFSVTKGIVSSIKGYNYIRVSYFSLKNVHPYLLFSVFNSPKPQFPNRPTIASFFYSLFSVAFAVHIRSYFKYCILVR